MMVFSARSGYINHNGNRNVMMNLDMPPFNDPDLRRAIALSLDRKAFVDMRSRAGDGKPRRGVCGAR
jgi:ABC-type transport system substrate-binding protein